MATKVVIQVAGPTAVGKTAMAIQLATWLNTEIISFDEEIIESEHNGEFFRSYRKSTDIVYSSLKEYLKTKK